MAHKEPREMKVYKLKKCQYKKIPNIELKNKWILNMVFDMGQEIKAECVEGSWS